MHYWGDNWFKQYGKELDNAISELNKGMRKIHVLCLGKEKYGTYRTDFFNLWTGSWLEWKEIYNQYSWFDCFMSAVNRRIGLTWIINKWQIKKINQLFQNVCKNHPDIVDELVSDTDCYMYIKPGKYGDVDGQRIRDKYWKVYINGKQVSSTPQKGLNIKKLNI